MLFFFFQTNWKFLQNGSMISVNGKRRQEERNESIYSNERWYHQKNMVRRLETTLCIMRNMFIKLFEILVFFSFNSIEYCCW